MCLLLAASYLRGKETVVWTPDTIGFPFIDGLSNWFVEIFPRDILDGDLTDCGAEHPRIVL